MTDFGPNKTTSGFYVRSLLIFAAIMITALCVSLVLVKMFPELEEVRASMVRRVGLSDDEDSSKLENSSNSMDVLDARKPRRFLNSSRELEKDINSVLSDFSNIGEIINGTQSIAAHQSTTAKPTTTVTPLVTQPVTKPPAEPVIPEPPPANGSTPGATVITVDYIPHRTFDAFAGEPVFVDTSSGRLRGLSSSVFSKDIDCFLGVPFAEPPLGGLRFRRTVPVKSWSPRTVSAERARPHCIQHFDPDIVRARHPTTLELSEDCLHLNIWTPSRTKGLPILIWLFGGGYAGGSNNLDEMDGRVLAALGQVVVVTANYRIGALGFLDMGTEEVPGNQGLHDNIVAIKWIKENAGAFGGDPERITLFGQSAGAISIGLLMTNPTTSGLFSRAILQSGSPIMLNFFFARTEETAANFIGSIGCSLDTVRNGTNSSGGEGEGDDKDAEVDDLSPVLECLMDKSSADIIAAQRPLLEKAYPFTPTPFDTDLLPLMSSEAIKLEEDDELYGSTFKHVHQVMLGTNKDEASVVLFMEIPELFAFDRINLNISTLSELKQLLIANFSQEFSIEPSRAHLFASMFFSDGPEVDTTENLVRRLYQVIGDMAFTCPVTTLAEALSKRGKDVYQYQFSQRAAGSPWGEWMGVPHGDEYLFVFGYPLRYPDRFSGEDIEMSKRMIETWSEFARSGVPADQLGLKWPRYDVQDRKYMELNAKVAEVGGKLHDKICTLFRFGFESFRRRRRRRRSLGVELF